MSLADQSLQFFPVSARVSVLQARGLRIKGKDGTNDAYATLQAGRETFRTPVAEKHAEPVWGGDDAAFIFTEQDGVPLQVRVLHRVPLGADKVLGLTVVNVHELRQDSARENPQWFKLLNKTGKADKERGEVLLDIQFLKSSMSVSMIDLSDKSHSRLGKFKDKLRGKKKEGLSDSASAILPSVSQVLTDSEEELEGETEGESTKKKKNKLKSLFVPKSSMKRNSMSQSMSSLGTLPDKNSSISSSTSSGLNVESEGKKKKKFTFLTHKRNGSTDSKTSNHNNSTLGSTNQNPPSPIDICINGSHVYREETQSEEVQEMEEEEGEKEEEVERWRREEEERERLEEERKRKEKEEQRRKEEEEKERIRREREKEEHRRRIEEEEKESIRVEREKDEQRRRMAEEKERIRLEREKEEERRRMEEREKDRIRMEREKEEQRRIEEEEKERIRMEREKEEQMRRMAEEKERIRIEREKEEERRRMEEREKERIRMGREKEEQRRLEEKEKERMRIEREKEEQKRRMDEEKERIRMEREKEEQRRRIEEEEKERIRMEREKEEQNRRIEEEEKERKRIEKEEQQRKLEEGERMRMKREKEEQMRKLEEGGKRKEERVAEELRRKMEEGNDRKKAEEEEMMRIAEEGRMKEEKKRAERKRMMEEEEKQKEEKRIAMERRLADEKKAREEEERRIAEEKEKQHKEEERVREEKARKGAEMEMKRKEEEQERRNMEIEDKKKKEKQMREEQERLRKEENLFEESVISQSTDFTRSARISTMKPSVSVSATVSQLTMANTNPFLDDDLDASISENTSVGEATAKKGRAPLPIQLTGQDVCSRAVSKQHSNLKEVSKRPAPQPPGTLKMTREVTVKENTDQAGLGQGAKKTPERHHESKVLSVTQDVTQVNTNPFTCDGPVAIKDNKTPAPKPRSGISMSEDKPRNGGKNLTESTAHLEEKASASNSKGNPPNWKLLRASNDTVEYVKSDLTDDLSRREHHLEDVVEPESAKPNSPSCVSQDLCPEPLVSPTDGLPSMERSQKKSRAPLPPVKPKRTEDPSTPHHQPSLPNKTNLEQAQENHSNKKDQDNTSVSSVEISAISTPSSSTVSSSVFMPLTEKSQVMIPCATESMETGSGSGSRTLPWAKMIPNDAGEVREQVSPTSVIRQHAVKPLSAAENRPETHESRVTDNTQPKTKAAEAVMKGPYSQLTQTELISLALRQQEQLSKRDARIQELEQYIDDLLVRVMEEKPSILMALNTKNKSI